MDDNTTEVICDRCDKPISKAEIEEGYKTTCEGCEEAAWERYQERLMESPPEPPDCRDEHDPTL